MTLEKQIEDFQKPWYDAGKRIESWESPTTDPKYKIRIYNIMELRQKATELHESVKEFEEYLSKYYPLLFSEEPPSEPLIDAMKSLNKLIIECDVTINRDDQ